MMRHAKVRAAFVPALALLALLASAREASACSCAGWPAPCQSYGQASAVFVGTVVGMTERDRVGGNDDWTPRVFKFAVSQPYRGIVGAEVEVGTGMGGGDCGYDFRRGETYLVYAALGGSEGKRLLVTSSCSRTRPVSAAAEDLEFLRGLASRPPGVSIAGKVFRQRYSVKRGSLTTTGGLPEAALVVEGEGLRREVRTDAAGHYSLSGLKPGAYKIRLTLPGELTTQLPEEAVAVADGGCATVDYYVRDNGRVSGRAFDAEGGPASGVLVVLAEAGAHDPDHDLTMWARADDEGRYSIEGVPPGRYLIAVNLFRLSDPDDPTNAFPRTYYPGAARPEDATVVRLGEGESVTGRDLRLPPRRAASVVEGRVVWEDDSPVANARLSYRDLTAGTGVNITAQADAEGRFTIKGYAGQTLHLEAWSVRPVDGDAGRGDAVENAEPVRVTLAAPTEPVKLTIRKLR